jgi:hypothetical protein
MDSGLWASEAGGIGDTDVYVYDTSIYPLALSIGSIFRVWTKFD